MRTLIVVMLAGLLLAACAPGDPLAESTAPAQVGGDAASGQVTQQEPGGAAVDETAPPRGEAGEPVIVFRRGGGLAGRSDEWMIYADGTVVSAEGSRQAVAPAEVEALLAGLDGLGFFEMQEAYGQESQCADCYRYEITAVHNGQKKTVTTIDAASDAPPELAQVIDQIQKVLGA